MTQLCVFVDPLNIVKFLPTERTLQYCMKVHPADMGAQSFPIATLQVTSRALVAAFAVDLKHNGPICWINPHIVVPTFPRSRVTIAGGEGKAG